MSAAWPVEADPDFDYDAWIAEPAPWSWLGGPRRVDKWDNRTDDWWRSMLLTPTGPPRPATAAQPGAAS